MNKFSVDVLRTCILVVVVMLSGCGGSSGGSGPTSLAFTSPGSTAVAPLTVAMAFR